MLLRKSCVPSEKASKLKHKNQDASRAMVKLFLSCSFKQADNLIVDHFRAILRGAGFDCINVSGAHRETPPKVATDLLKQVSGVVAVITKRDRLVDGGFTMPAAVREEIAMAAALHKEILIFCE